MNFEKVGLRLHDSACWLFSGNLGEFMLSLTLSFVLTNLNNAKSQNSVKFLVPKRAASSVGASV